MPRIFIDPTSPVREFPFNLFLGQTQISLTLSTNGKIYVRDIDALPDSEQALFRQVIELANKIKSAPDHQDLIEYCQTKVAEKKRSLQQQSTEQSMALTPLGENPFDRYFVSLKAQLPEIFSDVVPSMNVFVLLLAALFLIPLVAETETGIFIAIAISALALSVQLFSGVLERKLGVAQSRVLQDVFSAVTLSIMSFSTLRTIGSIFLNRALVLAKNDQNTKANFIGGSVVIALASLGTIGTWFAPAVNVMGPRVQAAAIRLERECLKAKTGSDASFRDKLVSEFKKNEGSSLAHRFFPILRKKTTTTDYRRDERMINPPSLFSVGGRLGSVFIRSTQFSLAFGINSGVIQTILLPTAALSLVHAFVNREFVIKAGRRSLLKVPAISTLSPNLAKSIKWASEISGVSYNSMINPAIAFFFVLEKMLNGFHININEGGNFGRVNTSLLALVIVLNVPSLIVDLSSRRLGIDRFEGWSASRLSYILEESQNSGIRRNLEMYLQLLTEIVRYKIKLPEAGSPVKTGSPAEAERVVRPHSLFSPLAASGSRREMPSGSIEVDRLLGLDSVGGEGSAQGTVDDALSVNRLDGANEIVTFRRR